ncbi:MAG: hypothetical protein U1E53_02970 [Dongiaceae bacterium]
MSNPVSPAVGLIDDHLLHHLERQLRFETDGGLEHERRRVLDDRQRFPTDPYRVRRLAAVDAERHRRERRRRRRELLGELSGWTRLALAFLGGWLASLLGGPAWRLASDLVDQLIGAGVSP